MASSGWQPRPKSFRHGSSFLLGNSWWFPIQASTKEGPDRGDQTTCRAVWWVPKSVLSGGDASLASPIIPLGAKPATLDPGTFQKLPLLLVHRQQQQKQPKRKASLPSVGKLTSNHHLHPGQRGEGASVTAPPTPATCLAALSYLHR